MRWFVLGVLAAVLLLGAIGIGLGLPLVRRLEAAVSGMERGVENSEQARTRLMEDAQRALNAAAETALRTAPRDEVPVAALPQNARFSRLSGVRVIDGDTLAAAGVRYRLANVDAPGRQAPDARCEAERQLGTMATTRAEELISAARSITAASVGIDRYGRTVAFVRLDGADLGETLVAAGLARRSEGAKFPWCNGI